MLRDIESLRIVDANKKAGEMFGCSREEMVTQAPEELFLDSGEYRFTKVRGYFEKARDGEPQLFEWLVRDKNGRMFWVEISMRKAAIGGSFRLLSIARDVTERRRLMEMKDDFMSMVSHELRTPLGIIKEGISLVLEGIAGDVTEKQKDVLGMAKSNTDRLARLIHQVLDFQKLNAGKMEFRFAEHDLNEIAGEVHRHSQALAAKKGLALELRADGNIPRIRFDRDRIVEVLMNLVNNAIKFTDKGGITISTCMKDGAVEVSVADSGCGVKPEDVPRLFQRFAQLERKPGGTGLGLAISKEIVETHRGRIWVESEYGKGATFRFMIPV
jgi:PAS domain S-box-containing protein